MEVTVKLGAMKDGTIRALDLYTLSNTGAFGEHGPTTVGLSGHKSIPMYQTEAFRFQYDVVIHESYVSRRLPRLWGNTGNFCSGIHGKPAGRQTWHGSLEIRYKNMTQ